MRETDTTIEYYFDCTITNGTPTIGGEEKDRMSDSNYYEVTYIPVNKISEYELQGQDFILKALNKEYTDINKIR